MFVCLPTVSSVGWSSSTHLQLSSFPWSSLTHAAGFAPDFMFCSVCVCVWGGEGGCIDGWLPLDRKLVAASNTLIRKQRVRTTSVRVTSATTEELFCPFLSFLFLSHVLSFFCFFRMSVFLVALHLTSS